MPATNPATSPSVQRILADPRAQQMQRAAEVRREAIDDKARTVEFSFASAEPVPRWFGLETLSIEEGACDLSRLNNSGACLVNHDWNDQVGVVLRAWIDKREQKARCLVKFSRSTRGQEIFQDIVDGVRELASCGYIVREMESIGERDGLEAYLVTDFQIFEVSLVAVPADVSVGVHRSKDPAARAGRNSNPQSQISVETTIENHAADIVAAAATLKARHPQHLAKIDAALADFVANKRSLAEFQDHVLNKILATGGGTAPAQVRQSPDAAFIGLNQRDLSRYSLCRAIMKVANNQPLDGIERETSDEVARRVERAPKGFFCPDDILFSHRMSKRTLLAGSAPDGGYTVPSQVLSEELVEVLRAESHVIALGGRVLPGLVGDIAIPRQLTGASVYWVSETGSIVRSSATFGQIVMKPRRIGASVPYSRQFLAQTSLAGESFVRDDILRSLATELDRVAICGTGGAQPLGILNMDAADRSTSVTFSAAATYVKVLEFEANVGGNNALFGRPAFLTTWATKAKWKGIPKFSNTAVPIWDTDENVAGYRGRATGQFPSTPVANQAIFGDFSQIVFGEWAGKDIIIDPFTGKLEGTIEVTIQQLVDLVVRQGKSFAISSDSGAQ